MADFVPPYDESLETIRGRMFGYIVALFPDPNSRPDLREPGELWTIFSTCASELANFYAELNATLQNSFVQFADAPYLDLLGEQYNTTRLVATKSVGTLRFLGADGTLVPAGSSASTEAVNVGDPIFTFDTTADGTVEGLPDPTTAPTAATGSGGNINGSVVYQYAYGTYLQYDEPGFGFTNVSLASSAVTGVTNSEVLVTIPSISWTPDNDLIDISEILIYRSYQPVGDELGDFSDYKYVGSITVSPKAGGVFTDNMTDADFLLIDSSLPVRGGVPDENSTGVVDVPAISEDPGLATAVVAGSIDILESDIPGIEAVTSPDSFAGGSDDEEDEPYRETILENIQAPAGAGNNAAYVKWAKEIDGIYSVSVEDEWDGPGTVKVIIAGENNTRITDAAKIEEVRKLIAGTIAITDPVTNPITQTPSITGGSMLAGTYEYAYTFVNEGGGETLPSPSVSAVIASGSAGHVALANIPLGPTGVAGPGLCTRRRIYRSFSGDTIPTLELVTEIQDNTTTTYTDTTAESALPSTAVPSGDVLTTHVAPLGNSTSQGDGEAPVGAHVVVQTISSLGVAITGNFVPEVGYSISGSGGTVNLATLLNISLGNYLASLTPGQTIKYVDVLNAIHDTVGVADFDDILIFVDPYVSGVSTNVTVPGDTTCVYVPGAATYTEVTSV